jgi:hypothetical protein
MSSEPTYDPEVLALLEEILEDRDSKLLRPKVRAGKALGLYAEPVMPSATFLTNAERHLLEWHREEVGHLLYQASLCALDGPIERTSIQWNNKLPEREALFTHASRLLRSRFIEAPEDLKSVLTFLNEAGSVAAAIEMAASSLRLSPDDDARICLATLFRLEGRVQTSQWVARDTAEKTNSSAHRSKALTVEGAGLCKEARFSKALVSYKDAALGHHVESCAAANWYLQALRLGDAREANEAAACLNDRGSERKVDEFVSFLSTYVDTPEWCPERSAFETIHALKGKHAGLARRIIDAVS